jgi:hypothetical protein
MTGLLGGVLNLATRSPPEKRDKNDPIARKSGTSVGSSADFHRLLQVFESIARRHAWLTAFQKVLRKVFSDVQPTFASTLNTVRAFMRTISNKLDDADMSYILLDRKRRWGECTPKFSRA